MGPAAVRGKEMIKPAFVDISHWQTIPDNLVSTAESGILGLVHKATEGTSYIDDKMAARHYLAQQAGLMWGVYHFVQPGSMQNQVNWFLAATKDYSDENTLFALD